MEYFSYKRKSEGLGQLLGNMNKIKDLSVLIQDELPDSIIGFDHDATHLIIRILPNNVIDLVTFLKEKKGLLFKSLIDITAVDYPDREKRFDLVYHFLSMEENIRCRIVFSILDDELVESITPVFECAGWFEREVFDMYGIKFKSHPDMRRILTDYGFEGYPLRKDFPTTGFLEVRYDEEQKRVVYEPTSLVQEYRNFDFLSPWENPEIFKRNDN